MTAENLYEKAKQYYDEEKYEKALKVCKKIIKINENDVYHWNVIGNIYYKQDKYKKAKTAYQKAINTDENFASPWNGLGNTYKKLGEYNKAITAFQKAIEIDKNFTFPLYGMGNVYYFKENYEEALKSFQRAIEIDEGFAGSWNGMGITYSKLGEFEKSIKCFTRANYLKKNYIRNTLLTFSKYPQGPFYTYELLKYEENYPTRRIRERKRLLELTVKQAAPLQFYISYLKLTQKHKTIPNWQWTKWLGVINFFMGHPIACFELFQKVIRKSPNDLQAYYYLFLSCEDFHQPSSHYISFALDLAKKYLPKKKKFSIFNSNIKYTKEELQQQYYAGHIFLLNNQADNAFHCFDNIKKQYLPAAYMCLDLNEKKTGDISKPLIKEILQQEKKLWGTHNSFAGGIPVQQIDLHKEEFTAPFFHYAQYWEVKNGIRLFHLIARKNQKSDVKTVHTATLKPFWYTWTLPNQQYQEIIQVARDHHARRLSEEILYTRGEQLRQDRKKVNLDETAIKSELNKTGALRDAYDKIILEISTEAREERIAGMLNDWERTDLTAAEYQKITSLLVLEKRINEKQKIFLDFYSILQEQSRKKTIDKLLTGSKDVFKTLIGKGIDLIEAALGLTGSFLDLFLKPFAKATIAELIVRFLNEPNIKFNTFEDFKKYFAIFIGEEKKRLGDKFDQKYPLYGYEEWIE